MSNPRGRMEAKRKALDGLSPVIVPATVGPHVN